MSDPNAPHPQSWYPPPLPPKPDHTVRNVLLAVFGGLAVVGFIGFVIVAVVVAVVLTRPPVPQADDRDIRVPTTPIPFETAEPTVPEETTAPVDPATTGVELAYKAGDSWTPAPASKDISRFNKKYDKPENWLTSIDMLPEGFTIVTTNNKKLNCGWTLVFQPSVQAGGCYRPEYGKVLFIYWGKDATDDLKELVLLHELSHFHQQWDQFDLLTSAYQSDVSQSDLEKIIETDATCRVYDEWGYDRYRYLDSALSAPCGDAQWTTDWMQAKFTKRGVVVTDW